MADVTNTFYFGESWIGYGSQFLVGQGDSPESFVAVADVISATFGEMTTGVLDKTHLRSPDRHREKLGTIRDSGPITVVANWRPGHGSQSNTASEDATGDGFTDGRSLLRLWRSVTEANFKFLLSDGSPATELPIRGIVTRYQPGTIGLDTKADITFEITPLSDYSASLP